MLHMRVDVNSSNREHLPLLQHTSKRLLYNTSSAIFGGLNGPLKPQTRPPRACWLLLFRREKGLSASFIQGLQGAYAGFPATKHCTSTGRAASARSGAAMTRSYSDSFRWNASCCRAACPASTSRRTWLLDGGPRSGRRPRLAGPDP